jgi:2-hydroxycyclohexanecarboxyl-CoA dehydrogenase
MDNCILIPGESYIPDVGCQGNGRNETGVLGTESSVGYLRRRRSTSSLSKPSCERLCRESKVLIFGREILCVRHGPWPGDRMRTAVVTGGGSGIGLAVAERLRKDGYRVATVDLKPSNSELAFTADVTDRGQIDAALAGIREELGPVTVLVNAAGLDGFKRFMHIEFADWQRLIDVNLNGVFHMIQAVLPDMLDAGYGRIVNISSSSTHSGAPFMSHYVAAKSAVNGLTKSLALEYGPNGITVNAVPPGFIDTPMLRSAEQRGNLGDIEKTIAATPVRRIGKPEDIAAACAFLVSEEAGYITGQILGVNGGRNT